MFVVLKFTALWNVVGHFRFCNHEANCCAASGTATTEACADGLLYLSKPYKTPCRYFYKHYCSMNNCIIVQNGLAKSEV